VQENKWADKLMSGWEKAPVTMLAEVREEDAVIVLTMLDEDACVHACRPAYAYEHELQTST
jgi:hypothetical protein